jgi:hypothetical protein
MNEFSDEDLSEFPFVRRNSKEEAIQFSKED